MIFFAVVCIGWVLSVCLHEFAHAAVAYWGGDHTVAEKGYLTLNPIHYTDPVFSVLMPLLFVVLGGIGLPGGAVYINEGLLRGRRWRTAVALAGPAASAVMMLLLALPFLLGVFKPYDASPQACCVAFLVGLQASAVILNLLPIPPLDGFNAIRPYLPAEVQHKLMAHGNTVFLVFFLLLFFVAPVRDAYWRAVDAVLGALGIYPDLFRLGFNEFRFWTK